MNTASDANVNRLSGTISSTGTRNARALKPLCHAGSRGEQPAKGKRSDAQSIFVRRSSSALPSTVTSDSAIAPAAISGLSSPSAASGIASTL